MTTAKPSILVGAGNADFYLLLSRALEAQGFKTRWAIGLEEIMAIAAREKPQAVLLDCRPRSIPAAQARDRLKRDGRTRDIPVIALLDGEVGRKFPGLLESGADDTLVQPAAPVRLEECIRAIRNDLLSAVSMRKKPALPGHCDVQLDHGTYRLWRNGRDIHLSPVEFRLLRHFQRNPEQALTRAERFGAVWRRTSMSGRARWTCLSACCARR